LRNFIKNPILVTGSHRSGSTWTGRMIANAPNVAYIHEPFNINHRPGVCKANFHYHFTYICKENEFLFIKDLEDCLSFKYHFLEDLKANKSVKNFARSIFNFIRFNKYRILKKRPLVKDPIAVFSADWLARTFDMNVVVIIRHPAAFVGSIKKVKWSHPFDHFLKQPLLMKQELYDYKSEIAEFAHKKKGIVDQGILLWNLIHHMIFKYKKNNPDWIFVKHEDISKNPIKEFKSLYKKLRLNFSEDIENRVRAFSFPENLFNSKTNSNMRIKLLKERITGNYSTKRMRNSEANIYSWKNRLSKNEVVKIKENTKELAKYFYTEDDWI